MLPATRWDNLNTAFESYLIYIGTKSPRLSLSFIDLLYVSNFKGGNSSIIDSVGEVDTRLRQYAVVLKRIDSQFGTTILGKLGSAQLDVFIMLAEMFVNLPFLNATKIRGFRASYASALLSAHFPELAPILDRNILAGAAIKHKRTKQGQVKKIQDYYGKLIRQVYILHKGDIKRSLRAIDRELFLSGSAK